MGQEVVIRDQGGVEHVFPPGFDPKRAAEIVQKQANPTGVPDVRFNDPEMRGRMMRPPMADSAEPPTIDKLRPLLEPLLHPLSWTDLAGLALPEAVPIAKYLKGVLGLTQRAATEAPKINIAGVKVPEPVSMYRAASRIVSKDMPAERAMAGQRAAVVEAGGSRYAPNQSGYQPGPVPKAPGEAMPVPEATYGPPVVQEPPVTAPAAPVETAPAPTAPAASPSTAPKPARRPKAATPKAAAKPLTRADLTEPEQQVFAQFVGQGHSEQEVLDGIAKWRTEQAPAAATPAAAPAPKQTKAQYSSADMIEYTRLRRLGKTDQEAMDMIRGQKAFQQSHGLKTTAEVKGAVNERNDSGRWRDDQ